LLIAPDGVDCKFALFLIKKTYNFDSRIFILPKYFGGANRRNLISAMTSQVNFFLQQYLWALLKAKKDDGCNVIGYTAWSMMDCYEWNSGYT
jgi:beta-glucosidase/6-phospho-beta-glucosidase/beta-galactosidase